MLKLDWGKIGWKHIKKCSDFSVQSQFAVYAFYTTIVLSKNNKPDALQQTIGFIIL